MDFDCNLNLGSWGVSQCVPDWLDFKALRANPNSASHGAMDDSLRYLSEVQVCLVSCLQCWEHRLTRSVDLLSASPPAGTHKWRCVRCGVSGSPRMSSRHMKDRAKPHVSCTYAGGCDRDRGVSPQPKNSSNLKPRTISRVKPSDVMNGNGARAWAWPPSTRCECVDRTLARYYE